VAEVIMNRVASSAYPDTVCGVVNQGTGRKFQCQFTYTCDGLAEVINEKSAYERLKKIAHLMVNGGPRKLTAGATHYHTKAVYPRWARKFPRTATIGVHRFYRMPTQLSQK
jgi:spore germination cell wall hydrolase CwlJ-like protein